jgi:DNA polymerase elongation subunit (family B)
MEKLIFQAVDWYTTDLQDAESGNSKFVVKIFGRTEKGKSVSVNVLGYTPYFYVQFTNDKLGTCTNKMCEDLQTVIFEELKPLLIREHKDDRIGKLLRNKSRMLTSQEIQEIYDFKHQVVTVTKRTNMKDMVGFRGDSMSTYIMLQFQSLSVCNFVKYRIFQKRVDDILVPNTLRISGYHTKMIMYESNISPMLRLVHKQNLQPSGWIQAKDVQPEFDHLQTRGDNTNFTTHFSNVTPYDTPKLAPLVVMSFDLECASSHGDFPLAKKGYGKTAAEIVDIFPTWKAKHSNTTELKTTIIEALKGSLRLSDDRSLSKVFVKKHMSDEKKASVSECIVMLMDKLIDILDGGIPSGIPEENDSILKRITYVLNNAERLPDVKGDPIIQIGSSVHRYGDTNCKERMVFTLGTCDSIEGVDVVECKTEKELITRWCQRVIELDPDIITGYNILGFDFKYLFMRAEELHCTQEVLSCGRLQHIWPKKLTEKILASSALGDNTLVYIEWYGRVLIDLMKVVQRDHKLDSYKLDHVASSFIKGKIVETVDEYTLKLDRIIELNEGDFLSMDSQKYRISKLGENNLVELCDPILEGQSCKTWGLVKDDVTPNEIFACQRGTSSDRARIAKYCVQDCALCNMLIIKLEVLANNIGMSNVCSVPLSFIFMRGQGIKIFSLTAKQCKVDNIVMPVLRVDDENEIDDGYEGAIVLDPKPGIYQVPVSVMDYASLYPSSMISENISHDSIVLDQRYANLENYEYVDITYDLFKGKGDAKEKIGEKTCRYAQFPNNEKGILPRILMKLLAARKLTRKKMEYETVYTKCGLRLKGLVREDVDGVLHVADAEGGPTTHVEKDNVLKRHSTYDDFAKAVLDGLQLAYKITANSLYGQVGSRTSQIYLKDLAASTTATGRNLILKAKRFMEENYEAVTIYGDTDSVFMDFRVKDRFGLEGKEALQKSIDLSIEASNAFKHQLKKPHDLEYEKTFWPFIILSKKKYIGNLYEHDINKHKQKAMGIVLKRRDNANILKIIYGGIIDIILKNRPLQDSLDFLKASLQELIAGGSSLDDLIITKTLRSHYADPTKIAHKVLQERMRSRDPGSAPAVNDRIPYVYIEHNRNNPSLLQGDKIEHPNYIRENNIAPDYEFYISNQLQNPISQLLSLELEKIPGFNKGEHYFKNLEKDYRKKYASERKVQRQLSLVREKHTRDLLFKPVLTDIYEKRMGIRKITEFFNPISN